MDILGHSQISVTMNIYGHVMPAMQQEAAGHIDAALGGIGKHERGELSPLLSALLSRRSKTIMAGSLEG
jgi:hypothetical protein